MATLLELKRYETRRKYESIGAELTAWTALAAAGQPLEKHHRQVERLARELKGMLNVVEGKVKELEEAGDTGLFFQRLPVVEFLILQVHRTWHFYRESLVARQGPPFASLLEALDELLWSCYHPAFKQLPEPPLVIFNGEWSPLASTRRARLKIEPTTDPNAGRYDQLKGVTLAQMVIPVVSLPWYTTSYLPLALLLAHEAGHLVEDELGLADLLDRRLRDSAIDPGRVDGYWLSRRAEVFADLYGLLALGPAFAGALLMLLSRSANEVLYTTDPGKNYPSYQLRMLITLRALADLGFKEDADALEARWAAMYAQQDYVERDYVDDVPEVICALMHRALPPLPNGNSLAGLAGLRWKPADQAGAGIVCDRLVSPANLSLQAPNPRVVLAGAQLAFERGPASFNPGSFGPDDQPAKVIRHILEKREKGTRGRDETIAARSAAPAAQLEQDQASGEAAARELLKQIEQSLS